MKTLYHATAVSNIGKIMRDGLKAGPDGNVYFCDSSFDSALYFFVTHPDETETGVIPVEFSEEELKQMTKNPDNAEGKMPDAYAWTGSISADRIPRKLDEMLKYERH